MSKTYFQEYKGVKVYFDEDREEWSCDRLVDKTYKGLKKKIDKAIAAKFKRQKCFFRRGYGYEYTAGEVTSIKPDREYCNVVFGKSERQLLRPNSVYLFDVADNAKIFDEIETCQIAIKELKQEINQLEDKLVWQQFWTEVEE